MTSSIKDSLVAEHGHFMSAKAICKTLCYPSVSALTAAKRRGKLPFRALAIEGRPGIFASTEEIADIVQRTLYGGDEELLPGESSATALSVAAAT